MINEKTILKNRKVIDFFHTFSANIINTLLGIVIAFMLPKYLGIEEYGFLKIFTFYVGYVGLLHFGFSDGIYIRYGKYEYDELPKEKFRLYFKFLLFFELVITLFLIAFSIYTITDNSRRIIFIFIALNIVILNLTTFFIFINQITRRFKIYSRILVFSKISFTLGTIFLIFLNVDKYSYFMILQTIVNLCVLIINIYISSGLVFGKSESFKNNIEDIVENFSVGFLIMVGNLVGSLILGMDRFFIDKFFTVKDFAMYSFSVSILLIFYTLLGSITTVTYPYLARANKENLAAIYEKMKSFLLVLIGFCLSGYFIIDFIVMKFIPEYTSSLKLTLVLFPTLLINGQISIVSANCFKALQCKKEYTRNNIVALILGLITNIIAYAMYGTSISIAVASLISFYLWEIYSDYFFKKKIGVNLIRHNIMQLTVILMFMIYGFNFNWILGFVLYIVTFIILMFISYKKDIMNLLREKSSFFTK